MNDALYQITRYQTKTSTDALSGATYSIEHIESVTGGIKKPIAAITVALHPEKGPVDSLNRSDSARAKVKRHITRTP